MSISFNHPKNTVTSTGTLSLNVTGGNTSSPQPIRFNSTSVIMPVRALPAGEAGAMVFDTGTLTMKYHDGLSWIEILGQDTILEPIYNQLTVINNQLQTKVDSVTYTSAAVPQASISGTQLNITFPLSSGGGTGAGNGLFTSSKQGAIQHYSLTSGMNAATIREQMSGTAGGQNGRNGSQSSPWVTNDGWTFSDGMWWTWAGTSGTVTMQVPNLNQQAYLKPMAVSGATQITNVISASATITGTALTIAQMPAHSFSVSGSTSAEGEHVHTITLSSNRNNTGAPDGASPWNPDGYGTTNAAGIHIHTFTGTTNVLGQNQPHTHGVDALDVAHFNVAVLYNIATPSYALNESAANGKYVLKTGDVMTGSLTIAAGATIQGDGTNLTFSFRNSASAERAMIYHSSTTNTLRFRANGGSEMVLANNGLLTVSSLSSGAINGSTLGISSQNAVVGGKNVVRSVNGVNADGNGNVVFSSGISGIQLGSAVFQDQGGWRGNYGGNYTGYVMTAYESYSKSRHYAAHIRPIQILISGTWYTISQAG